MRQRKIYLAGASSEYLRVRAIMDLLREQGHTITHDWTIPVERMVLSGMSEASLFEDEAAARVRECATGVRECDTFVVVVPGIFARTWGAPIELGLAWALGKDIFFLGELTGIFRTIATCTVSSESLLLQALRVDA